MAKKTKITPKLAELIEFLKRGIRTAKEMAEICDRTASSIGQMLRKMLKNGLIKKIKRGVFEALNDANDDAQLTFDLPLRANNTSKFERLRRKAAAEFAPLFA
ncbi:MAG: helix-turn-helix domain-containing protein [Pseudomonadota bacterium]